jgi:hypothetical protein
VHGFFLLLQTRFKTRILKKVLKKTVSFWFVLLFPLFFQCTEPSVIGLDIQPPSDQLNVKFTDTLSVTAYTYREDSVRSDKTLYFLLGSLNDPIFGKSQASFCTQINLPSSNVVFPEGIVVDSLVLSLAVKSSYGNDKYINPLHVNVYEISDLLYPDSSYFSFNTVEKKALIGTATSFVNISDSVFVDGAKLPPHIRINLDKNLAKRFIEDAANGYLTNNTVFTDYFRGILIEPQPVSIGGTIYYFDLLSTVSKMTLYYHTSSQNASFDFLINDKCARFNIYTHDYNTAISDFQNQLTNPDTQSEKIYLQSRAGTKINIQFPTIRQLNDPYDILVNKAELVFKVDLSDLTNSIYTIPSRLTLVRYKEDGSYVFIADQGSAFFGGEYDSANGEFKFNISRHIQSILKDGSEDFGIALVISGASTRADRVVLHGMLSQDFKPKLRLTYTQIN